MEFFSAFNLRNVGDGKNGLEMVSICHHREDCNKETRVWYILNLNTIEAIFFPLVAS